MSPEAGLDRQRYGAARLLLADRSPYLAEALFRIQVVVAAGLGTFAVDDRWRLYLDPRCLDAWSIEQTATVLEHEVGHLIRAHAGRSAALGIDEGQSLRFNIAADAEINDDLLAHNRVFPHVPVSPGTIGQPDGRLAEEYFHALDGLDLTGPDCGSGAHGEPRPWELPRDSGHPGTTPHEAELIRRRVAEAIERHHRTRGEVPAGWQRWADQLLHPVVDWRKELAAAVRAGVSQVAGLVDYTYTRPSRRRQAGPGPVLPAMRRPVPRICVIVDTSGSMGNDELSAAIAEVGGVLRSSGTQQVTVISCDAAVHSVQAIRRTGDVQLLGGGGTDMSVGLAAAERLRPRPDIVITITDGCTPWPKRPPARMLPITVLVGSETDGPAWGRTITVPHELQRA